MGSEFHQTIAAKAIGEQPKAPPALGSQRYVVAFIDRQSLDEELAGLDEYGISPSAVFKQSFFGLTIDLDANLLERFRANPDVLSIEIEQEYKISSEEVNPPWGLDRIDQQALPLDARYRYGQSGAGVTAYVIDTGLRSTHSEFIGRVGVGAYYDFGDRSGASDCVGHGTHVAGTIGGTTYGVAKSVTIVPVKVFSCSDSTTESAILAGINWVVATHQQGAPAVANMSFGGTASPIIDAAVQAMVNDGVTVVVAAGNSTAPTCNYSPARVSAVITVAASESNDRDAPYSNFGPCNDLFAPGTNVTSASNRSDWGSEVKSGTSMASPHVAGAAALILQGAPDDTPAQVWEAISANASIGRLSICCGDPNKLLHTASSTSTLRVSLSGSALGTVTSSPAGVSCQWSCSAAFVADSNVVLTAHPEPGSVFVAWSGACTGALNPCTVGMFSVRGVKATFEPDAQGVNYVPLVPNRLMESRAGEPTTVDAEFWQMGARPAGSETQLKVAGRGGVPTDATTAVLNVTTTGPQGDGYITIYPCGSPRPNSSNLNYTNGQTIPNSVITKIGVNGYVCIFTLRETHIIVDINGYFPAGSSFVPLVPNRLMESRAGEPTTVDAEF
ncbi:MAG: S8 family peptidase, partial [Actinomycetes bacterium]